MTDLSLSACSPVSTVPPPEQTSMQPRKPQEHWDCQQCWYGQGSSGTGTSAEPRQLQLPWALLTSSSSAPLMNSS